jgi:glutamate-1-semialdehyde 2,1-aminomutase
MDNRFAISEYPNAAEVLKQLDELIKKPIYTIKPGVLKKYIEDYYEKKCLKSKEMIEEAKDIIPGGVQHNRESMPHYEKAL